MNIRSSGYFLASLLLVAGACEANLHTLPKIQRVIGALG